jgi:Polyketide cyclase / dehydrase and lipid transport
LKRLAGVVLALLVLLALLSLDKPGSDSAQVGAQATFSEVSVMVNVSPQQAWEQLSDFSAAHNYVPNLARTEIVSERTSGLGAHRRVYDPDGGYLEETVIEWRDGSGFDIRLHQGDQPMTPFERAEFSYHLVPGQTSGTLVVLRMTIAMPFGVVGEKLAEWLVVPLLDHNLVQVAAGLKHYYETGRPASDEDRERLTGAVHVSPGSSSGLQ